MTRSQRRWHAAIWPILGPLALLGLLAAVLGRPPATMNASAAQGPARLGEPVPAAHAAPTPPEDSP